LPTNIGSKVVLPQLRLEAEAGVESKPSSQQLDFGLSTTAAQACRADCALKERKVSAPIMVRTLPV
jgi:hypothetical protein